MVRDARQWVSQRSVKDGVPVIMLSGSFEFPAPVSPEGVTMVEKPISEAQILQYLKPILKAGR